MFGSDHRPRFIEQGHPAGNELSLPRRRLIELPGQGQFIAGWVALLDEARAAVRSKHAELGPAAFVDMELQAVKVSLANLRTFPWIAERESAGRLSLHGCHFSIADGRLYMLDKAEDAFRPV